MRGWRRISNEGRLPDTAAVLTTHTIADHTEPCCGPHTNPKPDSATIITAHSIAVHTETHFGPRTKTYHIGPYAKANAVTD